MTDEEMAKQFANDIDGFDLIGVLAGAGDMNHAYRLGRYEGYLAGLKADAHTDNSKVIAELKKRNGELAGQKASLERWFGEAKEIIKGLLESCFGYNSKAVNYEAKARAEKFLEGGT